MPAHCVPREEQLSHYLSVRLTARQLQRLQKTLRNFEIDQGSRSDQLRTFFRLMYWRSLRVRRKRERREGSQGREERAPVQDVEEDFEEELEYLRWSNSLKEEQIK